MKKTVSKPYKYHSLVSSGALYRKKRFRSVIITRSALVAALCVISAVIFLFTALAVVRSFGTSNSEAILKSGMANAVPFLSRENGDDTESEYLKLLNGIFGCDFKNPASLIVYASPLFNADASSVQSAGQRAAEKTDAAKSREKNQASANLSIKNESKYEVDTDELLNKKLSFDISKDKPSVLIVHTHASESYTPSKAYSYEQTGNFRTQDENYNMIRVGNEIEKYLKACGVNVIHDKTINDYPSYNASYNKTEKVIKENLKNNPSIRFVFDIHRDAVGEGENGIKFTAAVNGEKAAQVMIVCGTDQNLENPLWRDNLSLALKIQNYFENKYPTFMRPLNLRSERFNMHLTTGSLLFEVGTNSNTLDEALAGARCLGKGLGEVINSLS